MKNKLLYITFIAIICAHTGSFCGSVPTPAPESERVAKLKIACKEKRKALDNWRKNPINQTTIINKNTFIQAIRSTGQTTSIDKDHACLLAAQRLLHSINNCANPAEQLGSIVLSLHFNIEEPYLENSLLKAMLEESQAENAKLKTQLAAVAKESATK
ncbi:MAG: hypothetical protein P4L31_04285 [Candidatus Babeliales bacterium]|nr:hypothetical protein [Candidatus Babeliales bacterium]